VSKVLRFGKRYKGVIAEQGGKESKQGGVGRGEKGEPGVGYETGLKKGSEKMREENDATNKKRKK